MISVCLLILPYRYNRKYECCVLELLLFKSGVAFVQYSADLGLLFRIENILLLSRKSAYTVQENALLFMPTATLLFRNGKELVM